MSTLPVDPSRPSFDLPKVAILDYYDSYTNNLLSLFSDWSDELIQERVIIIKYDQFDWESFQSDVLPHIACLILSPGPGRPDRPSDFGFASTLIQAVISPSSPIDIPILGICLGHQGIATSLGGSVTHVPEILHGQKRQIVHDGKGIFEGVPGGVEMVVYNSLMVEAQNLPNELEATAWAGDDRQNVMGLAHKTKHVYGVQFHPESICSSYGRTILRNFLSVVSFGQSHPSLSSSPSLPEPLRRQGSIRPSMPIPAQPSGTQSASPSTTVSPPRWKLEVEHLGETGRGVSAGQVFEALFLGKSQGEVWLDSSKTTNVPPAYSYLATPSHTLTYDLLPSPSLKLYRPTSPASPFPPIDLTPDLSTDPQPFLTHLNTLQSSIATQTRSTSHSSSSEAGLSAAVDWKAGWVGWLGYEMKDETLAGYSRQRAEQTEEEAKEKSRAVPDACFAYTDRVLAYEHATGSWVALGLVEISLMPASPDTRSGRPLLEELLTGADVRFASTQASWSSWLDTLRITLSRLQSSSSASALPTPSLPIPLPPFIPAHSGPTYSSKIDECRSAIREGESYELCLTTQFHSRPSSSALPSSFSSSSPTLSSFSPRNTSIPDSYSIYRRLRHSNPAPYASYINLPFIDVAVISSSPERFLKVSREGRVEMKPIKGTIGRCRGDPVEDERRKRGLENDKKEIAENLMIVDLIRADLMSVCKPSSVRVPKLIQVESYDHVHMLVTTVVGELGFGVGSVEALGRCFPPGSMTGAPKLRSVQLLDELEDHIPRSIYSGALGYLSVDGAADFSVVIRSMIAHKGELSLGAGGAITWLSDRDREWEEVLTKVGSVTKGFDFDS